MSIFRGPKITTYGLTFYIDAANIKSYIGTGTNVINLIKSTYITSLISGTSFSSDNKGYFVFNGSGNYIFSNATANNLNISQHNFSTEAWIYSNDVSLNQGIISFTEGNDVGKQYSVSITSQNLRVSFLTSEYNLSPIVSNTWYHIAHTYNYTSKISKLYINGILVSNITRTIDLSNVTASTNIGYQKFDSGGYFNGRIPLVRFYNKDISSSEVLNNYNEQKSRFY